MGFIRIGYPMSLGFNGYLNLEGISGADPLFNPHYRQLLNIIGIQPYQGWGWLFLIESTEALAQRDKALGFLNVRYISAEKDEVLPDHYTVEAFPDLNVIQLNNAWPRAFFTNRLRVYNAPEEFGKMVNSNDNGFFAAIHASQQDVHPQISELTEAQTPPAFIKAFDYKRTNNQTTFNIKATSAGVAVLHENFVDDSFEASINDEPVDYFRINHAFKGVWIDQPGTHTISFKYRPKYWNTSKWMFVAGLLVLTGLLIYSFRNNTKRSLKDPQ